MKKLRTILAILLSIYLVGCIVLFFIQDNLLFIPSVLPKDYVFRTGSEVNIPVEDDVTLNCISIRQPNAQGVILYLHGNRGSNRRCIRQLEMFEGLGYDLFMPDYRGFGKSDGRIHSEKELFRDAQIVYDHLKENYNESQISIVGYSLGTGIASYLASKNTPQHLFMLAPYVSFIDMKNRQLPIVPNFLIRFPLENSEHLKNVKCPVTMFHGTEDEIIPFDSSEKLHALFPNKTTLIPLRGTSHRRTIFHDKVRQAVGRVL